MQFFTPSESVHMLSNIESIPYMPLKHNYKPKMQTRLNKENIPRFIHEQEKKKKKVLLNKPFIRKSVKASLQHL